MSEAEKRRRQNYKRNRQKWIIAQAVVLVIVAIAIAVSAFAYVDLSRTYYIDYTESSDIDYKVWLKPNNHYDSDWLGEGQAYVASLIDNVKADFKYRLSMDAANVAFDSVYNVTAQLIIVDNTTKVNIFDPTYTLVTDTPVTQNSSSSLVINQAVEINYDTYNNLANDFIETYKLNDTTCTLVVTMNVGVNGSSDAFVGSADNQHKLSLNIPLARTTLDIEMTSSVSSGENKVLALKGGTNPDLFKNIAIYSSVLEGLLILIFIGFIFLSRNDDINYTNKVKSIVSAYRSFIQQVTNGFDTEGYQVLTIATFDEMLGIRDTIQSPILMCENEDQTCTKFFIPTNTKLLYLFEIKVDNYDEIYASVDEDAAECDFPVDIPDEPVPDPVSENAHTADESCLDEPCEEPEVIVAAAPVTVIVDVQGDADEDVDDDDEEAFTVEDEDDAFAFGARYDYSFEAKLALSSEETKGFYRELAEFALSYGIKLSRSWKKERVHKGRRLFGLLVFRGTKLAIALAMDPTAAEAKYHAQDVSMYKKYERTPMMMRITSPRKVKQAIELLTKLFEDAGLKNKNLGISINPIQYKSRKQLIIEKLIRTEVDPHTLSDTAAPIYTVPEHELENVGEDARAPEPEINNEPDTDNDIDSNIEDGGEDEDIFVIEEDVDGGFSFGARYDYSFEAKLALSSEETKGFYRELSEFALGYGVKVSRSWKKERVHKGRRLFGLLVFRGTKLAIALAMDPASAEAKYHAQDVSMYKKYERTPMMMRITSPRKVKQAIELLTKLFEDAGLKNKNLGISIEPIQYKSRKQLIIEKLIRTEVDPHTLPDTLAPIVMVSEPEPNITPELIEEALAEPTTELSEIDFVDEVDEVYKETVEHPGVEVIGVVWPERAHKNKIYRYDPNGEVLEDGDIVLVPTKDHHRGREVVRKAAVAHGNHKVDPDTLKHPLKKVIAVVKRKLEEILSGD